MRTLLVWLLLGIAPFTGVRLVCIEQPLSQSGGIRVETEPHCDTFCPRPARDRSLRSTMADMECLFLSNGTLLMVVGDIAVLPASPVVSFDPRPAATHREPYAGYLGPLLGPQPRPPRPERHVAAKNPIPIGSLA